VVSSEGEQLGIMSVKDALKIALEKELDLVEVAPTAKPPVCRIMDYGKYRYEQSKREREARKKTKNYRN
jgi:translation initiation factor IF-3